MENRILFTIPTFALLGLAMFFIPDFSNSGHKTPSPTEIRVLTYNIHHCNPPSISGEIDIEGIAKVIAESGAEIVALQEVDVFTERSGKDLHQAKELARLTGMDWHFHKSIDHDGGEYGNAILTSFPIKEKGGFALPFQENTEPRGVAYVKLDLGSGKLLKFASTHLDFTNEANTLMQAKHLNEYFIENSDPLIVAGDFNSERSSAPITYLETYFEDSCLGKCPPTFPQDQPKTTLDYIFLRKDHGMKTKVHEVIEETHASDHRPVFALIAIES
ncbi:endonuclease/exonuclease/phosphatase family protein [Pleomorphovibrio marinus]|uniref:endonuclease/exonuclease/phosphatase family protein n=1 Tax=Pleomorphovibrio marinus TaxID=2164132 RepID=UPI001E4A95F3|nr:endonuclease/exonuclease/phosphatase family protein [Pleomorphovibrio marinus]